MTTSIVFIATFTLIMCIAQIVRMIRNAHDARVAQRNVAHRLASMHARSYVSRDDMRTHQRIMR